MLELKMGQRGTTLLMYVGFCGEFPMGALKMFGGYYDYNRRVVTQLVREGYLKERKMTGYDRRVLRSLSLTEKGLVKLKEKVPAIARKIEQHLLAPPDGQGDRWKTLRLHRNTYCMLTAVQLGAKWLPGKEKERFLKTDPVYYGAYELNKMYSQDNKGARASGVLICEGAIFVLYYLGEHNMYWVEKSEKLFQDQVAFSSIGRGREIMGNIYVGEDWGLSKSLVENACRPYSRMIKFQRGMTHNYVTRDTDGIRALRTIVSPKEKLWLERRLFDHGLRVYARSTLQFDLEELTEYYEPPKENQYRLRPDIGWFFDFQIDAAKSFCNTGAELISVPGTLLYEKKEGE